MIRAHLSLQPNLYVMHFIVFILSLFSCNIDVKDETPTKFMGSSVTSIQGKLLKIMRVKNFIFLDCKITLFATIAFNRILNMAT